MFWVFNEVKRDIYKRTPVMQESENCNKNGANIELPLINTLEIKGFKLKCFYIFLYLSVCFINSQNFLEDSFNSYKKPTFSLNLNSYS